MKDKALGCKPDLPDVRDFLFSSEGIIKKKFLGGLPSRVDMTVNMPDVYDQGTIGSCTAQAVGAICDYRLKNKEFVPSALYLYYFTRLREGNADIDSGATIRNAIKTANEKGVCQEHTWPYHFNNLFVHPSSVAVDEASYYQALRYKRVLQRPDSIKECLAEGNPIAFGFSVYNNLYEITRERYILADPSGSLLGGHAVVLVGYDNDLKMFIVRNSWGKGWGRDGYFLMPYDYVLDDNLSFDFWTITLVENA